MAQEQVGLDLEAHLSSRSSGPDSSHLVCAIIDFPMGWIKHIFWKHNVPVVSFFTFGSCAAAMEWGTWKSQAKVGSPKGVHTIPGLPKEMYLTYSDFTRHSKRASGTGCPPRPGDQPPWVPLIEGSIGLMFNTCDDLEHPFIDYVADQTAMQTFAVGPLLHEKFWVSPESLISEIQIRQPKHQSNYSEEQVVQWLDTKCGKSVLYVAFGSEVDHKEEEYAQLASALEKLNHSFIWVVRPGSSANHPNLESKSGDRGLIIRGWAPQLLILSHPSTGGFLSHCGWNSTVEAVCRGVPILAWPIRGDQILNAKLVVNYLKMGHMALGVHSENAGEEELLKGMEKIMSDDEVHKNAAILCSKFCCGFPSSSNAAFDAFTNFIIEQKVLQY